MAFTVRKVTDALVQTLVAAWNHRQEAAVASFFHYDITQITSGDYMAPTVTNDVTTTAAAAATDLTTSLVLVNAELAVINRHFADTRAHDTAVTAAIDTAAATDLATGITLGNAIKAEYNVHLSESNVHPNNDGTNTIAAADATNQTTLNTLINEIRTDAAAHIISAPAGAQIYVVDA
jgi:hypothetical protein